MSALNNLSPIDFEELCRDLLYAETGMRFSAFGPGPDGGVDGRHSTHSGDSILQCKHYIRSTFSNLQSAARKEIIKIRKLKPKRYLFLTSHSLSPSKADELSHILRPVLNNKSDIWGQEDIHDALRRNPEIEKTHFKLWLSSTSVLDRILHSGLEAFTHTTKQEILESLRVYVRNPSFYDAGKILEREKVLIISGPPGVGKTTLARMICYYYLSEQWSFYSINALDEGFKKINDEKFTIFFFDDFLGRIQLNQQSLLKNDSAFAMFVRRICRSANNRFILTTRSHIFEEARMLSDYLDDTKLQLSKYLLNVDTYTRKVKAHILLNHLAVSDLSQEYFSELLAGSWLKEIIDHPNYNPRVIASSSSDCISTVKPDQYPHFILDALENPDAIWSRPFRMLSMSQQNLLIALFFGRDSGQDIDELRTNYNSLHRCVSTAYYQGTTPNDFEHALRTLESGFVRISGRTVAFVNPSVRDFLRAYLVNIDLVRLFPAAAVRGDWARSLWEHIKEQFQSDRHTCSQLAGLFRNISINLVSIPTKKKGKANGYTRLVYNDLSISSRVELLLDWWKYTEETFFLSQCLDILRSGELELDEWLDAGSLPVFHSEICGIPNEIFEFKHELIEALLAMQKRLFEMPLSIESLIEFLQARKKFAFDTYPVDLEQAIDSAVSFELFNTEDAISHLDSETDLIEHEANIDQLADLTGKDSWSAKQVLSERIALYQYQPEDDRPSHIISNSLSSLAEKFDDQDLYSLFSTLVE